MAKQLMPRAELMPRPDDVPWTAEQCLQLSVFAGLRRKPSLDRFPGAVVLRRYRQGEVICRQGEAGWTAFYVLTSEEVLEVLRFQLRAVPDEVAKRDVIRTIAWQFQRVRERKDKERNHPLRQAATVHLAIGRKLPAKETSWLSRLQQRWLGPRDTLAQGRPRYIPFDGPTDIDSASRQATLYEGELFGEMSCLNRTPRAATVVAVQDCYVLEMLRNILDQLLKDPAFKKQMDETYRRRVLQLHLRQQALFSSLAQEQLEAIHNEIELVTYEPDQLIYDEYDRADCLYIVRRGLVKVQKGVSALLGEEHVHSWPDLCSALRVASRQRSGPPRAIWRLLPPQARTASLHPDPEKLGSAERLEILRALNDLIKNPHLPEHRAFREILHNYRFRQRARPLLKHRQDWTEPEARRFNRLLLETALAGIRGHHLHAGGPEWTLGYCSRGELLGDIGLLAHEARGTTCIAYGQRVELMRISEDLLGELFHYSADIRHKLDEEMKSREKRTQEQLRVRAWEEAGTVRASEEADQLGLIQGQQLMLIDLQACTRCDECVRACASTHGDGRTRLFLDGPRFGHYLVPTTCRSCLDPVCMIGCPVGAIHRGGQDQITIEDWCIGCGLCGKQCPYGAIQMHDMGIISENARDWRYLPAAAVADVPWYLPGLRDQDWLLGTAPFQSSRDFLATVASYQSRQKPRSGGAELESYCFRYGFDLAAEHLDATSQLRLELMTKAVALRVWINGRELPAPQLRGGKGEYRFPATGSPTGNGTSEDVAASPEQPARVLRRGRNLLAVQVTPGPALGELLLQVRLDEVRQPAPQAQLVEEITQMLVTHRAVVCDLCSSIPGQGPACVRACPHEAALRVDARVALPVRASHGASTSYKG